jgi:hypothetical protein
MFWIGTVQNVIDLKDQMTFKVPLVNKWSLQYPK